MAHLFVALYRPISGNVHHWALFLDGHRWTIIFQAIDEMGSYQLNEQRDVRPDASSRHVRDIFVAQIDDTNGFTRPARSCQPQNDTAA